tara:strand:- start:59575 stop:59874 length:300 start_codon:yes stop_codon:yes gene_type:complete
MKDTKEYLEQHCIDPLNGFNFTCMDYFGLTESNLESITIYQGRYYKGTPLQETLSKTDLFKRLSELYNMCEKDPNIDIDDNAHNILVDLRNNIIDNILL